MWVAQQMGADFRFIGCGKDSVVALGKRAAAGDDVAVVIVANGLEFPHRIDQLQVAHMVTRRIQNAEYERVLCDQREPGRGSGRCSQGLATDRKPIAVRRGEPQKRVALGRGPHAPPGTLGQAPFQGMRFHRAFDSCVRTAPSTSIAEVAWRRTPRHSAPSR